MKLDRRLLMRILCVALVAGIMLPAGEALFPYVSAQLNGMQFQTLEAVLSATVGYGLSALIV